MNRDISHIPIRRSDHAPGEGMTIIELVAYFAGGSPTSQPPNVSPVLQEWMLAWADGLPDDRRDELRRYVAALAASQATPSVDAERQWLVVDWLIRVSAPTWLQAVELHSYGDSLITLPRIASPSGLALARSVADACAGAAFTTEESARRTAYATAGFDQPDPAAGPGRTARRQCWDAVVDATMGAIEGTATMSEAVGRASGYAEVSPADIPPTWRLAMETVSHASAAVGWQSLGVLIGRRNWTWRVHPEQAWQTAHGGVRAALGVVEHSIHESSHTLVAELLRVR